jgi:hypothetical protein
VTPTAAQTTSTPLVPRPPTCSTRPAPASSTSLGHRRNSLTSSDTGSPPPWIPRQARSSSSARVMEEEASTRWLAGSAMRTQSEQGNSHFLLARGPVRGPPGSVEAAGNGDHVMRAAGCGDRVVDRSEGGHPFWAGFSPAGQAGAEGARMPGRGLSGGRPQRLGPHHDPFLIGTDDRQFFGGARYRHDRGVEAVDIDRRSPHQFKELSYVAWSRSNARAESLNGGRIPTDRRHSTQRPS